MSYQVLARKWRPRSFTEMVGQQHVLKTLANALDSGRLHHAYLFTGTRGVGKTTLARILAKCLNCEVGVSSTPCGVCSACVGIDEGRFIDLIEVDAASRAKVEETRDLMDNVQYAPSAGRYKVYLIDEVHMFSNHSFNALLKTLEEPPPHVKFLLATTEPKKLPVTILSRCLQFNLKHLSADQIREQLANILAQEQIESDSESIRLLAGGAGGSMRDALSLLDQAIAYSDGRLEQLQIREMLGTIDSNNIDALLDALVAGNADALLQKVDAIAAFNADYDAILAELLSCLHNIAVAQMLSDGAELLDEQSRAYAGRLSREDVQLFYQIALNGRRDLAISPDPRTGFEMTLIRMLAFRPLEAGTTGQVAQRNPALQPGNTPAVTGADTRTGGFPAPGAAAWRDLIDAMGLNGLVRELASHCVLTEWDEHRIHLAIAPAHENLLSTSQKDRLQEALGKHLGTGLRVKITVQEIGIETPAEQRARAQKERHQAAVDAFVKDPDVQTLVDTFDATVDKNSIRT
jgi:DNA polymerase-3 subunit gamma/tau